VFRQEALGLMRVTSGARGSLHVKAPWCGQGAFPSALTSNALQARVGHFIFQPPNADVEPLLTDNWDMLGDGQTLTYNFRHEHGF